MLRTPSAAALALTLALMAAGCGRSNIEDLGTLGGPNSLGLGINAVGNVCGGSFLSSDLHGGGYHAFRWVEGLGMIDAGVLPPGNISEAQGINRGGLMVGGSFVEGFVPHAFLASATLNLTDLGTLGGEYSYAWDINDQGRVTGEAALETGDTHAFLWSSGEMRDLGTLGGTTSVGRSINESGQIAGESRIGIGQAFVAFRFTEGAGMVSLGTLSGGSNSSAYGINDSGQVVGQSDTAPIITQGFSSPHIFLFGKHAFLWTEGAGMVDLGHLGGGTSLERAINNSGVIVGESTLANGESRAFRWTQAGGMVDLNTAIPSNSGWVLRSAWDINDRGQITGEGLHNGASHAYRFNPPELVSEGSQAVGKQ